jgi:RES domain
MPGRRSVHDRSILDALEAIDPERFAGEVWRAARKGGDALRGSAANGRWSPSSGEFEVLYTSLERDGALAEIGYRLSLEPVWPSRIEHELHLIEVETERTLRFAELQSLAPLVIFAERVTGLVLRNSQPVDWDSWRQQHAR